MPKFSYSAISESSGLADVHYRIQDAADNRIATCYLEENARLIVDRLNQSEHHYAMLGVCKRAVQLLRQHLVHASPWGAGLVDELEAVILDAENAGRKEGE